MANLDYQLPKRENFQIAASNVAKLLSDANAPEYLRAGGPIVKDFLEECLSEIAVPMSRMTDRHSAFYSLNLKGFSGLPIFTVSQLGLGEIANQVEWFLGFLYAASFEATMRSGTFTNRDASVMTYFELHKDKLTAERRIHLDVFRGQIIAFLSVERQQDARNELNKQVTDAKNMLEPLSKKIGDWNTDIGGWERKVEQQKEFLKKQHTDLSFVGLSLAFSRLIKKKKIELAVQVLIMIVLGSSLIGALAYPSHQIITQKIEFDSLLKWIIHAAPVIAVELLLLYFFRIALRNYYSAKAQLLQLDLRYALCAFIEGYAEFSNRIKKNPEDKTLDKFEALVFSGITADIENIPSQFDGIDQLTSLIKGLRSKD